MYRSELERRAARHAALGDPMRLSIVDELTRSDRSPLELRHLTGAESNLLAHHLDVLESVGLISRSRSSGDGRRRYVRLLDDALPDLSFAPPAPAGPALFVCSQNSARSQLAAALWHSLTGAPAESAGTHPADRVHPGAVKAAERHGLHLLGARPRDIASLTRFPGLVVTVCDRAHEDVAPDDSWLHWSIPDPVAAGTRAAFDETVVELRRRISRLVDTSAVAS